MKLKNLISVLAESVEYVPDIKVNQIQFKSRDVKKGDVFVAIKGLKHDGHSFINEAISKGAVAVVGEEDYYPLPVPYIRVQDTRKALGKLAKTLYSDPSLMHNMIGITGTNGKTTTAYMLKHIFQTAQESCSLFSTVSNFVNGTELMSTATTPDILELNKMLRVSTDKNVVMEVSSHGLHQKRVEGLAFNYGIFTNLTHDHLDYHQNMDEYFNTKAGLFSLIKDNGEAIVNSSCPWGKKLINQLKSKQQSVFSFGTSENDDLQLLRTESGVSKIRIKGSNVKLAIKMPMPGHHNLQNALAAILCALRAGVNIQEIKKAVESFPGVSGRFEVYRCQGVNFVLDYAHTPDGLENLLQTVKSMKHKRIVHIFGFRGNKDVTKRLAMLDTSAKYCDEIILTLDDLNGVSKEVMISDLEKSAKYLGARKTHLIIDRTRAIEYAWKNSEKGDHIVITGKGPEPYEQEFEIPADNDAGTIKYLFSKSYNTSKV
ncbi:UDP-N-acetylmuramoyl-L-alanyl-D-glutamate--2,6-diaminopimelate ligase [Bacillus sp. ISL-47]|uniref:UDP-N-acetylmuramoyl-L-alanyl-D-glutamate--2, 6-diaminopimelate ligase n=1 Tax=Bacillus sp. ISL-47 TaxID=2819130 RepID=UPI001BEBBB5F|nr:UDP-N-acetylmuramoyl-L-alanyl-D-glutamate--2,6-diaminopimelate ligase [Bacillus sp. ISL-47]MBT2690996.1 UDP-N-acetylmuramoyl-L-alanyl-D-glutamate--2,6-diaminopimelate ligase [Bacillus sp. ISL-47]MBT2711218.1 UDP-N-acetylmuramoyl-L-alanyl-D-glutamate--2,6-diaminopimelate ligase [Pseudomonas sp. ISL-84]